MPYWPTNRDVAFDPNRDQFVVRVYNVPYGWFTYGPFASTNDALNWAGDQDWAITDFEVELATKRSPWKSMIAPSGESRG